MLQYESEDVGGHTVCAVMTAEFLGFSKSRGNDLSTPMPEFGFPGLRPGDRLLMCAALAGSAGGGPDAGSVAGYARRRP